MCGRRNQLERGAARPYSRANYAIYEIRNNNEWPTRFYASFSDDLRKQATCFCLNKNIAGCKLYNLLTRSRSVDVCYVLYCVCTYKKEEYRKSK